jgi:hypothetical protein
MTLETAGKFAEFVFGILWLVGWVSGIVAWAKRGYGIPRGVHRVARVMVGVGAVVAAAVFVCGVRELGFTLFMLIVLPAWTYVIWFLLGCPFRDKDYASSVCAVTGGTAGDNEKLKYKGENGNADRHKGKVGCL